MNFSDCNPAKFFSTADFYFLKGLFLTLVFVIMFPYASHASGFAITASAGPGGVINPEGVVVVAGAAEQTYTITPDLGFEIEMILVDGVSVPVDDSYTFSNVQEDHSIFVFFLPTHDIIASSRLNGTITPSGTTTVSRGGDQTYTITPHFGFEIDTLRIDGVETTPTSSFTFKDIESNHTIEATFTLLPIHTITATAGKNGTISPNQKTLAFETFDQTYTITPHFGFEIDTLRIDGVETTPTSRFTFKDIESNHTIEATFTQNSSLGELRSGNSPHDVLKGTEMAIILDSVRKVSENPIPSQSTDSLQRLTDEGTITSEEENVRTRDSIAQLLQDSKGDIAREPYSEDSEIKNDEPKNTIRTILHSPRVQQVGLFLGGAIIIIIALLLLSGYRVRRRQQ